MKQLIEYLEKNNIKYEQTMIDKCDAYRGGILQWNEFVNLTAIRDPEEFTMKHFVDSLTCLTAPQYTSAKKILDLGTGAGFPGVPLAIFCPDKEFVLVDSLNKKLKIVKELCDNIGINNVTVIHGRAEDLARDKKHRERYDLCVSRAVANLAVLCEYCLPFVKVGGHMLAYKGAGTKEELLEAGKAIRVLGGKLDEVEATPIDEEASEHKLIYIKKTLKTPSKYPRKAGSPAKEPLK